MNLGFPHDWFTRSARKPGNTPVYGGPFNPPSVQRASYDKPRRSLKQDQGRPQEDTPSAFDTLLAQRGENLVRAEDYPAPSEDYYNIRRHVETGEPFPDQRHPNDPPVFNEGHMGQTTHISRARRAGVITPEEAARLNARAEEYRPRGAQDFVRDMFAPRRDPDFEGARELGAVDMGFEDSWDVVGALAITPDPRAQMDIIRRGIPGIEVREDSEGRILARHPNDPNFENSETTDGFAYLNSPGVSPQDLFTFIAEGVWYAPAARVAGAARTPLRRILANAALSGTTSLAQDVTAMSQGSEQGVDPGRMLLAAGAGGAGEALAPLVGSGVRNAARHLGRGVRSVPDPAAVPMGPQSATRPQGSAAHRAGRTVGDAGRRVRGALGEESNLTPDAAARVARAREQGVTLNRAQTTQDPALMSTLDDARGGSYGPAASAEVRAQDLRQARDVARHARAQRDEFGNTLDIDSLDNPEAQAGTMLRDDLSSSFEQQRATVGELYDQTRAFGDVEFTGDSLESLREGITGSMDQSGIVIDSGLTPQTINALNDVDGLAQRMAGGDILEYSRDFDRVRRLLRQRIESASRNGTPTDAMGAQRVLDGLDTWLDDAVDAKLFDSPPEFFETYAAARGARAEQGRLFEPRGRAGSMPSRVGQTMDRIVRDERSANQVANWIMGNGRVGRNDLSLGMVRHLKSNFPEQFQVTREAVAARLLFGDNPTARQALLNPTDAGLNEARASYHTILRRIDSEMSRNPEYLAELFTPAELSRFRNYRNTLRDIVGDTTPANLRNRSGSGGVISRTGWALWNAIGTVSGARLLTQQAARPAGEHAGRQAVRQALRPVRDFEYYNAPLFTAGAAGLGALAGTEVTAPSEEE